MLPAFVVLGSVLASIYGLGFFLIFGQGGLRLLLYWFVSVAGFFVGQMLALFLGLSLMTIGDLNLVEGTVASLASLFAIRAWQRNKWLRVVLNRAIIARESEVKVEFVRDLAIILLAVESLVIGAVLIVLVLELRSLAKLLREEIKPILDSADETVRTVRGTTVFVSENFVNPLVRVSSAASGVTQAFRILMRRKWFSKTSFAAKVWNNTFMPERSTPMSDSRGWEFLTGFLLGSVVGAAAALMFAPQSGEEMREDIRERGIELKGRATDLSEQGRKRAEELAEQARQRAAEAQERGRLALEEQRTRLQQAIDEGKDAATKKREELMTRLDEEKAKRSDASVA
jgi:gas vesicle protein